MADIPEAEIDARGPLLCPGCFALAVAILEPNMAAMSPIH